ncbi:hypothetical protein V8E36_002095 [Tilletia maclaganii]
MASLDYGAPDDLDFEGGAATNNPEISLDELYEAQAQSAANKVPARFYEYPAQESIAAGQRRGVEPLGLSPAALEPVFPHEFRKGDEQLLPEHDNDTITHLSAPEPTYSRSSGAPNLRLSALHISGIPITQLSTSRLFAYVTYFGAQPLGLEWIDDERAIVVFAEPEAARLAFEYLCPPGAGRFRKKKKVVLKQEGAAEGDASAAVKTEGEGAAAATGAGHNGEDAVIEIDDDDDEDLPEESTSAGVLSASELVELIAHIDAQVKGGAEGDEMNDDDGDLDVEPVIIVESILSRLLRPRLAHRLPLSLYTGPEREALSAIKENAGELANGAEQPLTMLDAAGNRIPIPADAPAIYREMAEQERQAAIMTPEARKLLALRGKLHVRFALDGRPDVKERHARKKSKWFSDHGFDAGREVVPRLLAVGPRGGKPEDVDDEHWARTGRAKEELFPDRVEPASLARRDAWEDREGAGFRGRGRGAARAVMDDLDDELERYSSRRDQGEDEDRWQNDRAGGPERPQSRIGFAEEGNELSLLERMGGRGGGGGRYRRSGGGGAADRERSPSRRDTYGDGNLAGTDEFGRERERKRDYNNGGGGSRANVKGRGSVRAALAWEDEADTKAAAASESRNLHSRLTTLGERVGERSGEAGKKLLARLGGATQEGAPSN